MSIRVEPNETASARLEQSASVPPSVQDKAILRAQLYFTYLAVDVAALILGIMAASTLRFGYGEAEPWARNVAAILLPVYVLLDFNIGAFQLRTLVSTVFSIRSAAFA